VTYALTDPTENRRIRQLEVALIVANTELRMAETLVWPLALLCGIVAKEYFHWGWCVLLTFVVYLFVIRIYTKAQAKAEGRYYRATQHTNYVGDV
jgi:hypothetical protein